MPVTASTRRLPEPTDDSEVSTTVPIWDELRTWVPPHSSRDQAPPISITRTFSPYCLAEQRQGPDLLSFGQRHPAGRDLVVGAQGLVRDVLDIVDLLRRQRAAPAEVEPQAAGTVVVPF